MRLSTQFKITLFLFTAVLVVIAASAVVTSERINRTRAQESLANSIVQGASELGYYAGDYVIYRQDAQLNRWQTRYSSFAQDVANLNVDTAEQQSLVSAIQQNQLNMKEVFNSIISSNENTQNASQNIPDALSSFQVSWSRMTIQTQTLIHLLELRNSNQ